VTPEQIESLAEALYDAESTPSDDPSIRAIRQKFGPSFKDMALAAMPLVEGWIAEARADERRNTAEHIAARARVIDANATGSARSGYLSADDIDRIARDEAGGGQ